MFLHPVNARKFSYTSFHTLNHTNSHAGHRSNSARFQGIVSGIALSKCRVSNKPRRKHYRSREIQACPPFSKGFPTFPGTDNARG